MFWVYILKCTDGSYYTGHTDNLEQRLDQHHAGACDGYTATRRPVELVWSQECVTREEALSAELRIKGWSRAKKEAMMRVDWAGVNQLGRGKHRHQRVEAARQMTVLRAEMSFAETAEELLREERDLHG